MNNQEQTKSVKISQLLTAEAEIINKIHDRFISHWPEFDLALDLMNECDGRIILTGMGKSGHVAKKITATMASLGKPTHYVHPAEASHGDLGMLVPGDVLVALSNSGNTSELGSILNYAKAIQVPIIGITMGAESTLARMSAAPLIIPKMAEGCSLGLAPTTSTTAQMAMGDALAVGVAVMNDFTRDNFNTLHPGGALGKSTSKVEECMLTGDDVPLATADMNAANLCWMMARKSSDICGVVDEGGSLIGLVYAADVNPMLDIDTSEVMRTVDPVVSRSDSLATAISRMQKKAVSTCFVVEGGQPVGIVRSV